MMKAKKTIFIALAVFFANHAVRVLREYAKRIGDFGTGQHCA
jgi:hypothetical protein